MEIPAVIAEQHAQANPFVQRHQKPAVDRHTTIGAHGRFAEPREVPVQHVPIHPGGGVPFAVELELVVAL